MGEYRIEKCGEKESSRGLMSRNTKLGPQKVGSLNVRWLPFAAGCARDPSLHSTFDSAFARQSSLCICILLGLTTWSRSLDRYGQRE